MAAVTGSSVCSRDEASALSYALSLTLCLPWTACFGAHPTRLASAPPVVGLHA